MNSGNDLKGGLLEEIALEGLDGITIDALFLRLTERKEFPMKIDDYSKGYLWKCVTGLKDIQFYALEKPRAELVPYNRFDYIDPATFHYIETDEIKEDIYTHHVVEEEGVLGSCADYGTRKNITDLILSERPTLLEVHERYGSSLVIVADQEIRVRTLLGPQNDPQFSIQNVTYCLLERIARSRYSGVTSATSVRSLRVMNIPPKTVFYHIKKLRHYGVIDKQRLCVVKKSSGAKTSCQLYHLKRFTKKIENRQHKDLIRMAKEVVNKPEQMMEVAKLKEALQLYDKEFKKISQLMVGGERIFMFVDIPYRELHPEATTKEYMIKSGKGERCIRHIKLLKSMEEIQQAINDDSDAEEEEEEAESTDKAPIEPLVRSLDKPLIQEIMGLIRQAGSRGMTQVELGKIAKCGRLAARRYSNFILRSKLVTTVMQDRGRQKIIVYVAVENMKDNVLNQKFTNEIEKFTKTLPAIEPTHGKKKKTGDVKKEPIKKQDKSVKQVKNKESDGIKQGEEKIQDNLTKEDVTEPLPKDNPKQGSSIMKKIQEIINEPLTGEQISAISQELDSLDENQRHDFSDLTKVYQEKKKIMKQLISEDENLVEVKLEELYTSSSPGSSALGLKRFGMKLSESHVRRINWIVEVTAAIKVVENFRILKLLRNREKDMNIKGYMDRKSLMRLAVALAEEQKIRCYSAKITVGNRTREITYLCAPYVDLKSDYLLRQIEEAKLRYFTLSKEEIRKQAEKQRRETVKIKPPKKKEDKQVPSTAIQSIKQQKEYIKQIRQNPKEMKYNRKAGLSYGLLPKMLRIQVAHQYLFHLCHDVYGHKTMNQGSSFLSKAKADLVSEEDITMANSADKVLQTELVIKEEGLWPSEDPPMYFDEWTWRRYLAPLPAHSGYTKGWCLVSDVLLRLPVYLFCQIVNVCYDIDGLLEVLNDKNKRLYPVLNLPWTISHQLLYSKKYVQSFMELCGYLCEMGLLSFGREIMKEIEQTFIYIHQNASLTDTRDSLQGYNKTKAPPDEVFPTKQFHFDKLSDLHDYWENLQVIALASNLSYMSKIHDDLADTVTFEERSLKMAVKPYSPEAIVDDGVIPGDRRGAAGIDSSLFVHCLKNWTFKSMTKEGAARNKQYRQSYTPKVKFSGAFHQQTSLASQTERKVVDMYNKGQLQGKERLCISDNPDKPIELKVVRKERTRGNRGGKGIQRLQHSKYMRREDGRLRLKRLVKYAAPRAKRKRAYEKGDTKDQDIYATKTKMRVVWSDKEDSVMLMCKLATMIMDGSRRHSLVKHTWVRDLLHENCGEIALDKTSNACNRRIRFVLKNKNTENNILLYYREALQDENVVKNYVSDDYIVTDPGIQAKFKELTAYLLKKFQTLNVQKCSLPETLEELNECKVEPIEKLVKTKEYQDPTCKEEICEDVLRNILHCAVLLSDKIGRTHEMFKLLSQYPDFLLSHVIKELREDGLYVIHKKHYQKESVNQLQSGLGLRNFKVSQRYMYNYKHRYLSTLFQESAEFLDKLQQSYANGEEGVTLDYRPEGGQSAILIPLVLQKMINFKVKIPEELVVIDMKGFYNFPWGRGKTGTFTTKADKTLQEIFNKKKLIRDKTGNQALESVGKESVTKLKAQECDWDEEMSDIDSESVKNLNTENSGSANVINKTHADNKEDVSNRGILVKSSGHENTSGKPSEKIIESSGETLNNGNKTATSSESDNAEETDTGGTKVAGIDDISNTLSTNVEKSKGVNEDPHDILAKSSKEIKYDTYKHGSSTLMTPAYEDKAADVGQQGGSFQVTGFASRTLLSLRRAEDQAYYSFEDIRIFNAQDNFVVKSCEIDIKLRDKTASSTQVMDPYQENSFDIYESHGDETIGENPSEKQSAADRLRMPKQKMQNLWTEMQRLLPFKLDMADVWESLSKYMNVSDEYLDFCKNVYKMIESQGELGIKMFDLQTQFKDTSQWKSAVKLLMHYAAGAYKLLE